MRVQRIVSCTTTLRALQISAFAGNPSSGNASITISTGDPNSATDLLGLSNQQARYGLNGTCRPAKTQVALGHHGLTSAGVVHSGDVRWPAVFCSATPRVLLHFVLSLNSSGKPVSAKIAIATQSKKSKPIAFIQWSPAQSVTYYKPGCTTQEQ